MSSDDQREYRCVWCGLPQFGEDRCICDDPKYEVMEQCSKCGDWKEVDHLHVPESADNERVVCTDGCLIADGGSERVRKYLYLITDHPNDTLVGSIEFREGPYTVATKNEERTVNKRNVETGETHSVKVVGLGYHDFESSDPDPEVYSRVSKRKLSEIDGEYLEAAGLDPEEATAA